MRAEVMTLGTPNPRQREFLACEKKYVAFGGARGGGKSWAVRCKAKLLALRYAGIRILLVRRSLAELEANHLAFLRQELADVAEYRAGERQFRFCNGSVLQFGYCGCDRDLDRYQGAEYDVIFLDEATQLKEQWMRQIAACVRGVNDFPKRIYYTCNPGGPGHGYIKRLFIDRRFEDGEQPEDYAFIPALGYTPAQFWDKANTFGRDNRMDGLLAYMYTMIAECRAQGKRLDRDFLVQCGHSMELFPGVREWFGRINAFGEEQSVTIEHYVISSGLREIIEGSGIAHEFREIYACEFFYNAEGLAAWPKLDVNFTNKTQFVYRINKGVLDVSDDKTLNDSMPDDSKRIPFTNMIYVGDGLSDVPCMKMMRAYGGQAIAVYQAGNRAGVEDLLSKGRVDFIFPADYREGTGLDSTVKNIIRKMAISDALTAENVQQLQAIGRGDLPEQVGLFE